MSLSHIVVVFGVDRRFSIYSRKQTALLTVKPIAVVHIIDRLIKLEDFSSLMAEAAAGSTAVLS